MQILWNHNLSVLAGPQSATYITYGSYECSISVLDRIVDG